MTDLLQSGTMSPERQLVIFAPYPPARNGIADYVAELMPPLAKEFDITLVVADDAPLPSDPDLQVLLASEFGKNRRFFKEAKKLYHIGNNHQHCYMLDFLPTDPGVVVLHDFNLCYLHEMATIRWGNRDRHRAQMEREFGTLGTRLLEWQWKYRYRESFTGYELPLNGMVLEHATAVISHSRQSLYGVAGRIPGKPVWRIPHLLSPRANGYFEFGRKRAREELGLPPDRILVTAFGFVTRAKQIPLTLEALAALRDLAPPFRFVLAGERRPSEYDVDADIARSELRDQVICTDYLEEDEFFKYLAASDIVVNLRYPSVGEMSGTLIRALGLGLPTVVLDHGPMGELPDSIVEKVQWDDNRLTNLISALGKLMVSPEARQALGSRAAAYIRREHDVGKVAAQYARVIRESQLGKEFRPRQLRQHFSQSAAIARKLRSLGESGKMAARQCDTRTWWTIPGIPLGGTPENRALVITSAQDSAPTLLERLFDWKAGTITRMTPEELIACSPAGKLAAFNEFAFALVIVSAMLPEPDAAFLLRSVNAALHHGGNVCLETWADIGEPGQGFLGRETLVQRLQDAGFSSVRSWSPQDGFLSELVTGSTLEPDLRRFACVTGHKASDYAVWRFSDPVEGLPLRWGGRIGYGLAR